MLNFLATTLISAIVTLVSAFGIYQYLPLSALETLQKQEFKAGAAITSILGTDTISSSRSVINTNFTNLNNGKIENSTTSVAAITTLSSLATVGTITSGTWTGSVIDVARQGTGTTSPSRYQVILGNGSNGLTVASSTGTSGQFLTSNGANAYPSWQTSAIDTGIAYTWTNNHIFSASTTLNGAVLNIASASTTFSSATTTWDSNQRAIGIGTSTPSLLSGLSVATSTYFSKGVGIGVATTTNDPNLDISGALFVGGTASTTNLIVSGTTTGGPMTYTGSSTAGALTGSATFAGSIPATANTAIGTVDTAQDGAKHEHNDIIFTRTGKTSSIVFDRAVEVNECEYNFAWSGTDLVVTETDVDNDCTSNFTIYWYK